MVVGDNMDMADAVVVDCNCRMKDNDIERTVAADDESIRSDGTVMVVVDHNYH